MYIVEYEARLTGQPSDLEHCFVRPVPQLNSTLDMTHK